MQIYISLIADVGATCIFDIKLNNPISSMYADSVFSTIDELVNNYKQSRIFNHISTLSSLSNLIGENGKVTLDPNLEHRTHQQINRVMKDIIENYEGFEFFITSDNHSIAITSTDEGSTEIIKQYLCA